MRFPEDLVYRNGAKGGVLMYVAEELPHIPQAKMMVKNPSESIDDALERADKLGIGYPRIFRSSAVVELYGYEGEFPTVVVDGPDSKFYKSEYPDMSLENRMKMVRADEVEVIESIQNSPKVMKKVAPEIHGHLPDEICVIIAEKSPSSIVGTYVKHPNQDDFYVISIATTRSSGTGDVINSAFTFSSKRGIRVFENFSKREVEKSFHISDEVKKDLHRQMSTVVSWHDQIANLPKMDPAWAYQIEFGLDPLCLYQARPFKKIEMADFKVRRNNNCRDGFVFGITLEDGINVRAEVGIKNRYSADEIINPENEPSLFFEELRKVNGHSHLPNLKVNLFSYAYGILAHDDVQAIRRAEVTALFPTWSRIPIYQGKWYNVKSNGKSVRITEIPAP